ncbi:MAG: hypothetical protein GY810_09615 [Aureispira sp.]|nr:hypothetical protein [Aureispira sp.]
MRIFIPLIFVCLCGAVAQANELLPLPGDSVLYNPYPEVEELTKSEEDAEHEELLIYGTINYSEEMPIFIGTGLVGEDYNTQKENGDKQFLEYIYQNIETCVDSVNADISMLVVSFKVTEKGLVEDIELKRGDKEGCLGQQAIRLVERMNTTFKQPWKPGEQRNKVVSCRYNLPIKIRWIK